MFDIDQSDWSGIVAALAIDDTDAHIEVFRRLYPGYLAFLTPYVLACVDRFIGHSVATPPFTQTVMKDVPALCCPVQ